MSLRTKGPFSAYVTPREDVLLATLTLLRILVAESLLAATLLGHAAARSGRAVHTALAPARDLCPRRGRHVLRCVRACTTSLP